MSQIVICLLRGVNVGGTGKLPMKLWQQQLTSFGLLDVSTYIQSGNAVFRATNRSLAEWKQQIEDGLQSEFGWRRPAILRSREDWHQMMAANPFKPDAEFDAAKLNVSVHAQPVSADKQRLIAATFADLPERCVQFSDYSYTYFPNGMGRTKLPLARIEKLQAVETTTRNWRTVCQLMSMADSLA
jgi:uncharacterized protein (DUF1697 family)